MRMGQVGQAGTGVTNLGVTDEATEEVDVHHEAAAYRTASRKE